MHYVDKNVKELKRIFDQNSRKEYLRLDLNENPGGLSEDFIHKVLSEITPDLISKYPETLEFTQCLAEYHKTDISHICLTNGSAEAIRYIIEAFTSVNGEIVGVTPTYAMFEIYAKMYGRKFSAVQYTYDLEMPIERILEKMSPGIELLILVNPNNPMGNVYSDNEFEELLKKAKQNNITMLIDEAYSYFYPKTFIKYALQEEHIFVTRTFSKLFSMAGCRLGYVLGWPEGIEIIQKLCTPHNVNVFAELFAQRIIEEPGMIGNLINKHKEGREYLQMKLDENNYKYKGEAGNFIFIQPKTNAGKIVKRMKDEKRILIKEYKSVGRLGDCLRVSIGERKYMKIFLNALFELDQ